MFRGASPARARIGGGSESRLRPSRGSRWYARRDLMFQDALKEIVDKTDGGIAGLIMDSEGIAVESYARDGATFDINTIGIEFGVVLGSIKRAAESLDAGKAHEVSIGTDKVVTLIRTLGESYFLAVAMRPDGNLGKGRFLMRTAAPRLLAELG